jgi:hypothetical protein
LTGPGRAPPDSESMDFLVIALAVAFFAALLALIKGLERI